MKTSYLVVLGALILGSCSKNESTKSYDTSIITAESAPPPPPVMDGVLASGMNEEQKEAPDDKPGVTFSPEQIKVAEKIKKTANLTITVNDYKEARAAIEKIVKSGKAYISGENEQNSAYSISNNMSIRVANKEFDVMVNQLLTVAKNVNSKNITAEDVTAQFVNIQSRLKSKKEIEKRYIDILGKASKVSDILEIEQNLGQIREEIEAKEGELKYLSDQVDYSTVNLTFFQEFEYTPTDKPGFLGRLSNALTNGWYGFLTFLVGIAYAWPLWLVLAVGGYILVRFVKRKKLKK